MKRFGLPMMLTLALCAGQLDAQVATEWVETRAPGATNVIALGYPVPVPVDTPLPFDGFRTYAGLHSRHLDLVDATPWVHPESIGLTRYGRNIPAYRLGDADLLTIDGLPEPASLVNGGIHAREWQSPEVVTGLMELMALHEGDAHFYDYLRDNANMVVIPVLNVDGFLQTQRYPELSYMQSDPDYPDYSPRDGRMRRKNMLSADEDFWTTPDHLNGVDLNRNSAPFWATNPERSSPNLDSIVHHGSAAASEPEIQALDAAAHLGPIDKLRIYTDAHSFSQVHFWSLNNNGRLSLQTEAVLRLFTNHHWAFPAGKYYYFRKANQMTSNHGIGTTAEYFTHTYQVPSWTLEIEPGENGGADYGGAAENGHDGFILPESEIRRVREQVAQSFAAVYYRQAGPPSIQSLRVLDPATQAVVFEADWDPADSQNRSLFTQQLRALQFDHDYELWMSFNKPMRWREDGQPTSMPGVSANAMYFWLDALAGETEMTSTIGDPVWLDAPGKAPGGYANYVYDAVRVSFNMPGDELNRGLVNGTADTTLKVLTPDMATMKIDANPATVVDWSDGAWTGYENDSGVQSDSGGYDTTISLQVSSDPVPPPFVLEPGITASWYDPTRDGEGFLIELLENDRAVMYWFTYDDAGNQDWYVATGKVIGNRIEFRKLKRVSGGVFGPEFDPQAVTRETVGSASFIWSGCNTGTMSYRIGTRHGRMQLNRITQLLGVECGMPPTQPVPEHALLSGSWYDPTHDGEGYLVEVLPNDRVVAYWFSYDPDSNRRWFFDAGRVIDGKLVFDDMRTTLGGVFGPGFDPDAVQRPPWGTLELDLECDGGTATYSSTEEGFGAGVLNVIRLTSIDQFGCGK